MRVLRRDEGRVIDSQKQINVDRRPPRAALLSARPSVIAPEEPGQLPEVSLRYKGASNEAPVIRIFRTGEGPPRLVLRFRGGGDRGAVWDGRLREGRVAPEGDYAFTVQVRDRAGNPTEACTSRVQVLPCVYRRAADLMALVPQRSVVFVGGDGGRWWPGAEQRLAQQLARLGCRVVFVHRTTQSALGPVPAFS
jgi:hypothetical protein